MGNSGFCVVGEAKLLGGFSGEDVSCRGCRVQREEVYDGVCYLVRRLGVGGVGFVVDESKTGLSEGFKDGLVGVVAPIYWTFECTFRTS